MMSYTPNKLKNIIQELVNHSKITLPTNFDENIAFPNKSDFLKSFRSDIEHECYTMNSKMSFVESYLDFLKKNEYWEIIQWIVNFSVAKNISLFQATGYSVLMKSQQVDTWYDLAKEVYLLPMENYYGNVINNYHQQGISLLSYLIAEYDKKSQDEKKLLINFLTCSHEFDESFTAWLILIQVFGIQEVTNAYSSCCAIHYWFMNKLENLKSCKEKAINHSIHQGLINIKQFMQYLLDDKYYSDDNDNPTIDFILAFRGDKLYSGQIELNAIKSEHAQFNKYLSCSIEFKELALYAMNKLDSNWNNYLILQLWQPIIEKHGENEIMELFKYNKNSTHQFNNVAFLKQCAESSQKLSMLIHEACNKKELEFNWQEFFSE